MPNPSNLPTHTHPATHKKEDMHSLVAEAHKTRSLNFLLPFALLASLFGPCPLPHARDLLVALFMSSCGRMKCLPFVDELPTISIHQPELLTGLIPQRGSRLLMHSVASLKRRHQPSRASL